jgi:hypothetical protein
MDGVRPTRVDQAAPGSIACGSPAVVRVERCLTNANPNSNPVTLQPAAGHVTGPKAGNEPRGVRRPASPRVFAQPAQGFRLIRAGEGPAEPHHTAPTGLKLGTQARSAGGVRFPAHRSAALPAAQTAQGSGGVTATSGGRGKRQERPLSKPLGIVPRQRGQGVTLQAGKTGPEGFHAPFELRDPWLTVFEPAAPVWPSSPH